MPAERSRGSRRTVSDGNQLVWTMPVEPTTPNAGFAFAPNVTPVTFNDPPPMVDAPPCESILFPPPEDSLSTRRPAHSKKKPENHIPRPPNAFILFRSSFIKSQHVSTEVETNHSTLSKIIGLTWQNLPHEERQVWHAKAKAVLDEHKRKFPQYAFRPLHTKGRGPEKRKVREVGPKDQKRCAKIAELLVEGKKGHELDAAIQEFDRHHVPEVVTRFEAPLTASMYRRSSSVPIPDNETFLPSNEAAHPRKIRASSSQPTRHSTPAIPEHHQIQKTSFDLSSQQFPATPSFSPSLQFAPSANPSFDFNSFSFDADLVASLGCATRVESPQDPLAMFAQQAQPSRFDHGPLSINTSFSHDWTRSSSPLSSIPTSPSSFADSPFDAPSPADSVDMLCNLPSFTLDAFQQASIANFDIYSNDTGASFNPSNIGVSYPTQDFLSKDAFVFEPAKPQLAQLDMDFSAFMTTLPTYTM